MSNKPNHVFIIAEAGVNHNGDIELAKKLVEAAAAAGADAVKFQTFRAKNIVTRQAAKASYQQESTANDESQFAMLKRLELTHDEFRQLSGLCKKQNILFLSTPFDIESLELLNNIGIPIFKIPSGEITNLPLLRSIGYLGKKIILSTGMADIIEIKAALHILEKAGTKRDDITLLHCNTEYPTPMQDVNLRAMTSMADIFGVAVGYSDHTLGIEIPIAAVSLGAAVIEKHFTIDKNLAGPDHRASLDPAELNAMVAAIRNIEIALGDDIKKASASELPNRAKIRKSIFAAIPIKKDDAFSASNLCVKRPGTGISPMKWDDVIGRRAKKNFTIDEEIEL